MNIQPLHRPTRLPLALLSRKSTGAPILANSAHKRPYGLYFARQTDLRHTTVPRAAIFDSDDYEQDPYDSDDYEVLEEAAVVSRSAAQTSSSISAPSSSASVSPHALHNTTFSATEVITDPKSRKARGRVENSPRQAISSGVDIFLLFGAAIDRFVSSIQAAAWATLLSTYSIIARISDRASSKARASFKASPPGRRLEKLRHKVDEIKKELPDDTWGKLLWLWDRPHIQKIRLTISMANLSIRLPALLALVATQVGLLASQVSLPMLAPLLLGTGMLMRSVQANASFLFPRIGLVVVIMWLLWFANSVVQATVNYLRKQGALDTRLAGGIITVSECSALLVALVVLLSMLGVNVSALLLPAGVAVAVAAKDMTHNFLAGFFLFVVQPFKLGDRLAVTSAVAGSQGVTSPGGWFEGVCEKVDLRYTVVRQGRRRLMIPNSSFLTREFMVLDDGAPTPGTTGSNSSLDSAGIDSYTNTYAGPYGAPPPPPPVGYEGGYMQQHMTNDYRRIWQYVEGPPVHQELAGAYAGPVAATPPNDVAVNNNEVNQSMTNEQTSVEEKQHKNNVQPIATSSAPLAVSLPSTGPAPSYYPPSPPVPPTTTVNSIDQQQITTTNYYQSQPQQPGKQAFYMQQQQAMQQQSSSSSQIRSHPLNPEAWGGYYQPGSFSDERST